MQRDSRTYLLYAVMFVFGFSQSVLGSIMPFHEDELDYTTVQVGWHFTAYAVGVVAAGLISRAYLGGIGTSTAIAGSLVAMGASIALSSVTGVVAASLVVAVAIGLSGVVVQIAAQAEIINHHDHGDVAITEAFVFAGAGVLSGPLVIGGASELGSWRWAMLVPLVLAVPLALYIWRHPATQAAAENAAHQGGRLPRAVLVCWVMVVLGIATEWGIGFWGAQFLERRYDLTESRAVTLMAVFFGGTVLGRIVSSRVLRHFDTRAVLSVVLWAGTISVFSLWAFPAIPVGMVMLAVAGMSLGNLFPLVLSVAVAQAGDQVERISSGSAQAVGIALLTVPVTLGYVGDQIGLVDAVGLLTILPVVMIALLLATRESTRESTRGQPARDRPAPHRVVMEDA